MSSSPLDVSLHIRVPSIAGDKNSYLWGNLTLIVSVIVKVHSHQAQVIVVGVAQLDGLGSTHTLQFSGG